ATTASPTLWLVDNPASGISASGTTGIPSNRPARETPHLCCPAVRDNHDDRIARLATLTVDFAANVQPGQIVGITSGPGKEALTHAVAELAYQRGAKFVDLFWFDSQIKRSRIEHADEETLDYVPPWYGQRALGLGEHHAARIAFSPPVDPDALDGLNPAHAGRDRLPVVKETLKVIADRSTNCAPLPCPTH